jgi:hypothetical protein
MKNLKRIDEAVGSILERRAAADRLLKDVINGNASEVEGIKLSKEMAQGFLDWLKYSTYGKKFGALPFYKLFTASFNWGLDRFVKGANTKLKDEFKELKAKASEMRKAEKFESVDEAIDLLKSTWRGTKGWNDVARIMDAGLMKAIKAGNVPLSYAKDYVKSLERMAKRNAKKFFDDYGNFTEEDFIEDVEYNLANESKVNEAKFSFSEKQVKDVAEVIAKAIEKLDNMKTAVHDMEYDAGRGAGFEISMGGDKYEGGSYVVRPNGEVYNAAIGNSFPNAVYAKIGDTDIRKVMKNIKKFESVTEAKFVKSYDTKVNNAETEKDVLKIYPKAKFFVGKMSHFFGELEPNLFFKAYYPKYYKQDTGKSVKGDFKITSVYSKKGSNYVELMESFKSYSKFVSENYDTEQRKEMAAKGFALADGSFPIANLEDLKNAIMAYGRAKDQAKAAKFIAKRAKALGAEDLIPDTEDFQKSLKEGIEDVYTQVPAKTIAIEEGKDIGSWNQGGLKGDKNVLITTFVGPKDIEDFGLGRKCMQINVGMDYISLNPADIAELKDILKSYKVK